MSEYSDATGTAKMKEVRICSCRREYPVVSLLTQGHSTQEKSIYGEGDAVYEKNAGDGKQKLYVHEVLDSGDYKLRRSDTQEPDVLDKVFHENELRPWVD